MILPAQADVKARLHEAESILTEMSLEFGRLESNFYYVLYVGRRDFALERQRILVKTRQNFLGFTRRLKLDINHRHEKLLVILLDDQRQMKQFASRCGGDSQELADWVAGYYSPERNWAVFYNQRSGEGLKNAERELNRMAQRLINLEGGPDVIVRVQTPNGVVSKSKRQVAREIEAEWARLVAETMQFNTVVTQHEGAHQLAYNVGVQQRNVRYPFWLSEGLACVFESPPDERQAQGAGRLNTDRLLAYRAIVERSTDLGLQELISLSHPGPHHDVSGLYAESWAVFSFFFKRYPTQLAAYMRHLAERTRQAEPESEADVLASFMKKPVPVLQREFTRYIEMLRP